VARALGPELGAALPGCLGPGRVVGWLPGHAQILLPDGAWLPSIEFLVMHRSEESNRVDGSGDAVLAFAATLLVVGLEVPRSDPALPALVAILSVALSISGACLNSGMPGYVHGLLGPVCYLHGRWSSAKAARVLGAQQV
jgi:hypothetical protein